MKFFIWHILSVTILLLALNQLFINQIANSRDYISTQLKYFILKISILSSITCFFCFFSPINSTKFILSSLMIFIIFHFIEAVIIQNKINMKDPNG